MEIVIGIIGLLLAAAALVPLQRHFFEDRVSKFTEMQKVLSENSYRIREKIKENWGVGFPYLLHLPAWNHQKGTPLIKISDVTLIADNSYYDYNKIKKFISRRILLPKRRCSIVDNLQSYGYGNGVLYDAPTYGVCHIEKNAEKLILHVKRGTYFDFVNTCFGYGYEAAYEKLKGSQQYSMRQKYPIVDFNNRFAMIGIVTLVVMKNVLDEAGQKQCYCFIHERGQDVIESKGLVNAIPGATFQPSTENAKRELGKALINEGLQHTIIREILEEMFNVEEFSELTSATQLQNSKIWNMLNDSIYYLGCGLNPINAYLELLACAVVDMEQPYAKEIFGVNNNDNSITAKNVIANYEGSIKIKIFSETILQYHEKSQKSAPALSQICKIILDDYHNICSQLGIG